MIRHEEPPRVDTVQTYGSGNVPRRPGLHLYVLQDSTGRIKVGRSSNVERRRSDLQNAAGRHISIVLILYNRGDEEQRVMAAVRSYRKYGEWFANSDDCRDKIAAAIGEDIKWPMPPQQHLAEWRERKRREGVEGAVSSLCDTIREGKRPRDRSAIEAYLKRIGRR